MTRGSQYGYTLVEMLVALVIAGILVVGLGGVMGQVLSTHDVISEKSQLTRNGRFAMEQMSRALAQGRLLLVPLVDKPATDWQENLRQETVPASPPEGSSTRATAVLAVTISLLVNLDGDDFPDADDDRDGRIDEDFKANRTNSLAAGIFEIDDDGDGDVDEGEAGSDDESTTLNDDPINGIDDDGDDNIDEDPPADMNGDGCSGVCRVDDDGDGQIDEGAVADDDEDGLSDEDGLNPVVFYLDNSTLVQRTPVPWDADSSGQIDGRDFIEKALVEDVSRFRVERLPLNNRSHVLVDLTLELTSQKSGETVSLHTRVRVGAAL